MRAGQFRQHCCPSHVSEENKAPDGHTEQSSSASPTCIAHVTMIGAGLLRAGTFCVHPCVKACVTEGLPLFFGGCCSCADLLPLSFLAPVSVASFPPPAFVFLHVGVRLRSFTSCAYLLVFHQRAPVALEIMHSCFFWRSHYTDSKLVVECGVEG